MMRTPAVQGRGPIDRFRTPHTKQLHVVERYRLNNGGKNIEITFTVEDPGAFTMPWKAKVDFERGRGARSGRPWEESICTDSPRDYFADDKAWRRSDTASRQPGFLNRIR